MATGQLANLRRPHLGEGPGSGQQPKPEGPKVVRGTGTSPPPRIDAKGTPQRGGAVFRKAAREAPATRIAHAPGSRTQAKGNMVRDVGGTSPRPGGGAATPRGPSATGQLANLRRAHLGEGAGSGVQPKPTGGQAPVSVGGNASAAPRALERGQSNVFRKASPPPRAPRTVLRDMPARPAIPRERTSPQPREGAVTTMAYSSEQPPAYQRSMFRSPEPDVDQWPHGEMIDMAKTPEEIREDAEKMMTAPVMAQSTYPYGLSICLENDQLEKLGFNGEMPAGGDILEFFAAAKVTCAKSEEKIDPISGEVETCMRIEMQICEMAIHEEEPPEVEEAEIEEAHARDRRQRFYGGDGEELPDYDDDDED